MTPLKKSKLIGTLLALAIGGFSLCGSAYADQLLQNGDFENPVFSTNSSTGIDYQTTLSHWNAATCTVVNGNGGGWLMNGTDWIPHDGPPAQSGNQYLTTDFAGGLTQNFLVGSSGSFTLTWYDNVQDANMLYAGASEYMVFIFDPNASLVASGTFTNPNLDYTWYEHQISGNLPGANAYSLVFNQNNPVNPYDHITGNPNISLDNVSMDFTPSEVPEPSSWAMLLIGTGAVALKGYARRKKA